MDQDGWSWVEPCHSDEQLRSSGIANKERAIKEKYGVSGQKEQAREVLNIAWRCGQIPSIVPTQISSPIFQHFWRKPRRLQVSSRHVPEPLQVIGLERVCDWIGRADSKNWRRLYNVRRRPWNQANHRRKQKAAQTILRLPIRQKAIPRRNNNRPKLRLWLKVRRLTK